MNRIYLALIIMVFKMSYAIDLVSSYIKVNNHWLHYYQTDSTKQPIVLLTGYATTSNFWNKQFIRCLAQTHQVFIFDYQGVNVKDKSDLSQLSIKSMAEDVNSMVRQLNIKKPLLLGWSMGGAVALEAGFLAPKLYEQLYLLSPVVPTGGQAKLSLPMPDHQPFKSDDDVLSYVFNNNLYGYNSNQVTTLRSNFIQDGLEQIFPEKKVRDAQSKAIAVWVSSEKIRDQFNKARIPAIFYLPDHDHILNQNIALPIALQYPDSTVIRVKNSGHAIAWEIPEKLCLFINQPD